MASASILSSLTLANLLLEPRAFLDLKDAIDKAEAWRVDFNQVRSHSSLGYLTPIEFAE